MAVMEMGVGVGWGVGVGCDPSDAMVREILLKSNLTVDSQKARGDLAGWKKSGTETFIPTKIGSRLLRFFMTARWVL